MVEFCGWVGLIGPTVWNEVKSVSGSLEGDVSRGLVGTPCAVVLTNNAQPVEGGDSKPIR